MAVSRKRLRPTTITTSFPLVGIRTAVSGGLLGQRDEFCRIGNFR